jgi:2,4-dienoyl-CoA reductase-like NADH-dependent reductase (Old Yellow Enzyme family)/thioredoxin reductase
MKLLTPIYLGSLPLKNRIAMPAMATNFANMDGSVSDRLIQYYRARAAGGTSLIMIEFTTVLFGGRFTQNQLRVDEDRFVPGLARLVEILHQAGAKTFLQLHHSGRRAPFPVILTPAIAPSPLPIFPGAPVPREMNPDEIRHVREAFIQGAVRARRAGFDGVELHATHGYLLAQFLSPASNRRTDEYGGNPERRAGFPLEILRGIKEAVGRNFPVMVKMTGDEYTPGGIEIEEALIHARLFAENGADALCVSGSAGSVMAMSPNAPGIRSTSPPVYIEPACYAHLAARVKKEVNIPVMAIGRINDPAVAESLLLEEKADLIAVGRGHIADPEFTRHAPEEVRRDLVYCIGCLQGCIERSVHWANTGITCAVNPRVGREGEEAALPAGTAKKVWVVGGGPAGMHAAAILAERGHQVTLFDQMDELGGNVRIASVPPKKKETLRLIRHLAHRLEKSGARMLLHTRVDGGKIRCGHPETVVIATGAKPRMLELSGMHSSRVLAAEKVLEGEGFQTAGGRAIVVGGGLVGCETALSLAQQGWGVTILEMFDDIGMDVGPILKFYLRRELNEADVQIRVRTLVCAVGEKGVVGRLPEGDEMTYPADLIVVAVGYEADRRLFEEIRNQVRETYLIGDALSPRKILEAMKESFNIAQII